MNRSTSAAYILSLLISLILAAGFYIDGRNATINNLSSDQWNILPVCIKLDHPDLYNGDLVADNLDDVNYYTPFFVNGVRFFTRFSNDNYIEGLNKYNFLINFLYTFLWTLFFYYIGHDLPIALLMSLLVRGILWLPGYELWGIGALWTALPRTAFLALLPLPMILFLPSLNFKYNRFLGAFFLGLTSNFHPISGLGLCVSVWLTDFFYQRFVNKVRWETVITQSFKIGLLMLIGLTPYIYIYLTEVAVNKSQDALLFNDMLPLRIGDTFRDPFLALNKFKQFRWILFIGFPVLMVICFYKKLTSDIKKTVIISGAFMLIILSFSLLTVPVGNLLRKTGLDLHMSFQLIRNIKYVMIPVFVFYMVILLYVISLSRPYLKQIISTGALITFIVFLFVARIQPFDKLPLTGDDFIRSTLPNIYSIKKENLYQDDDLDFMFDWININIDQDAKFVGPPQLRTACRRSVVFDFKGASMLIEGNPDKFVQWGKSVIELTKCVDIQCKIDLYKSWGADYLLIDEVIIEKRPEISIGLWNLYPL